MHEEELEELVDLGDPPSDEDMRPRWLQDTLRDAEGHNAPIVTFKESRPPQRFFSYVALMSNIIDLSLPVLRKQQGSRFGRMP
jgi:hypothetical protein